MSVAIPLVSVLRILNLPVDRESAFYSFRAAEISTANWDNSFLCVTFIASFFPIGRRQRQAQDGHIELKIQRQEKSKFMKSSLEEAGNTPEIDGLICPPRFERNRRSGKAVVVNASKDDSGLEYVQASVGIRDNFTKQGVNGQNRQLLRGFTPQFS